MTRRVFSPEFTREVAPLVTARGVSVAPAAKDLDGHATVLRRWVREFGSNGPDASPGKGQLKPDDEVLRSLRREVAKLKAERDILKKPQPASLGTICDVWVCREAPRGLAGQLDV